MGPALRPAPPRRHQAVHHPEVGPLELTYHSLQLPTSLQTVQTLTTYTAEPGSASEDGFKLLASLVATGRPHEHAADLP